MTPHQAVREEFDFPFELYPFQIKEVNKLCEYDRCGFYWEAGSGKTAGYAHFALHHSITSGVKHWILLMPPILLLQWARYLGSIKDTQFRIWATERLHEYLEKGFTMDDARLKNLGGGSYWKELLDRIRDIRSSEKVLYRQVLDLYATSVDYTPKAEAFDLLIGGNFATI